MFLTVFSEWRKKRGCKMKEQSQKVSVQKDDIIECALRTFSEKGYSGTNMADISDQMGVTRTPLYYHFKNKEQLFEEAFMFHTEKTYRVLKDIHERDITIFEKIEAEYLYLTSEIYVSNSRLADEVRSHRDQFEKPYERLQNLVDDLFVLKRKSVEKAIECGELKKETDTVAATMMIYVFYYGLNNNGSQMLIDSLKTSNSYVIDTFLEMFRARFAA